MKFLNLSKPGKIGSMSLRNRMIQPAMETWSAGPDGTVTESTIAHYARRAAGGVGLVITEMTNPTPGCMCFPGELEMSEDKYMPGMSKIADAIHAGGAKAAVQLGQSAYVVGQVLLNVLRDVIAHTDHKVADQRNGVNLRQRPGDGDARHLVWHGDGAAGRVGELARRGPGAHGGARLSRGRRIGGGFGPAGGERRRQ